MTQSQLRVSIVIPAHNEERHLQACLEAIAAQTVLPYEVIMADNNCDDDTAAIARLYPFVRVVHASQQGIVYARNAGFDAASGDIIGRIDADILLPPNWVQHIQNFYAQPENMTRAWSGCGFFYNVRLPRLVSWAYGFFAFRLNKLLLGHYTLWGSNMALPRSLWRLVRSDTCLRTDIHEDLDLAIHLNKRGYGIAYDTSIKTNAELRRVMDGRDQLWHYLHWWPRALRVHQNAAWPLAWFFGVLVLYCAATVLAWIDSAARTAKRQLPAHVSGYE